MFNKNDDLQKEIDDIKKRKNNTDYNSNNNQPMKNDYSSYGSGYDREGKYLNPYDKQTVTVIDNKSPYEKSDVKIAIIIVTAILIVTNALFCILAPIYSIIFIFLAVFEGVGLYVPISKFAKLKKQKERCTQLVDATVVRVKTRRGSKGRKLYCPVFVFEYAGRNYKIDKDYYSNISGYNVPVGSSRKFYINPRELSDNYEANFNKEEYVLFAVFALVGYGMALLMLFLNFVG